MKTEKATSDRIIVELPTDGRIARTDVTSWNKLLSDGIGPKDLRESLIDIREKYIDNYILDLERYITDPKKQEGVRTMAKEEIFHLKLLIDALDQVKEVGVAEE